MKEILFLIVFSFDLFVLIIFLMSVSHDQATDAAVFLTLYKEAIETIESLLGHIGNQLKGRHLTRRWRSSLIALSK